MTEPSIILSTTAAMTTFDLTVTTANNEFQFDYLLYSDGSQFDNWSDWVNDTGLSSPTAKQLDNASIYTSYVLKLKCKLRNTDLTENNINNACGLVTTTMGGIWIVANTAGEIDAVEDTSTVESNTYTQTAA